MNLQKSPKVYKQSESSESDPLATPIPTTVVGYSQGSVIVWILLGVAAGSLVLFCPDVLSWSRREPVQPEQERDSQHMQNQIRAMADIRTCLVLRLYSQMTRRTRMGRSRSPSPMHFKLRATC